MYFQIWKYVIWQQIHNPQNIIHVYSEYIITKIILFTCSNFKSFDLDTLFQGSNTAFMGMFKNWWQSV